MNLSPPWHVSIPMWIQAIEITSLFLNCMMIINFIVLFFQSSGVSVSDVCKTVFEEIKKDKKHRYVIFFIRDEKQIDVEKVGDRGEEYDSFLEDIQQGGPGECR